LGSWARKEGVAQIQKENAFLGKISFLGKKNSFSQVDPKTVVQNFILYNIALGYILKFQLDFEIGI
jgi:hypothetical protein